MAKEKQTSVKILQTQHKKKGRVSSTYLIFGGVGVLFLLGALILSFNFFKPQQLNQASNAVDETQPSSHNNAQASQSNDDGDYKNQVDDQQLSGLFKPQKAEKKVAQAQAPSEESRSPFAIFSNQQNSAPTVKPVQAATLPKPHPTPLKPVSKSNHTDAETLVKPSLLSKLNIDKELENANSDSVNAPPLKAKEE